MTSTSLDHVYDKLVLTDRPISHDEAHGCAQRLINSFFHNPNGAVARVPADKDNDDDLVLMAYIAQQEARADLREQAAAFTSLRNHNPKIEQAVAAVMMRVQSGRDWDDAPVPIRKIWCEAARQVIDALVDAALKEGMQNANPG